MVWRELILHFDDKLIGVLTEGRRIKFVEA